jgi:hypothetical protein
MDVRNYEEEDVSSYWTTARNKGKAIPVQTLIIPEDSSSTKLPNFMTIATWRW